MKNLLSIILISLSFALISQQTPKILVCVVVDQMKYEFVDRFWEDFGKVLEPKIEAKIDFWSYFCDPFFERASASIFGRFFEAPNLKNSNFVSTGARFSLNRCFRKSSEKTWILATFSEAKTKKIR